MLSIGRPDNGARQLVGSSLKFIVGGVFVNGKMAISLAAAVMFHLASRQSCCFKVYKKWKTLKDK